MPTATLSFHAELKDFLAKTQRNGPVRQEYQGKPAVKHLIEALGIPHTEVGRILIDGRPATLADHLEQDVQIEVFPLEPKSRLDSNEPTPAFILDIHLGRLAAYLRMLGFDLLYDRRLDDSGLAGQAAERGRVLLTRDRRLLMRKNVERGYWVRSLEPEEQAVEILKRFGLRTRIHPFRRCLVCNHSLEPVFKETVLDQLEPLTRLHYEEFHRCAACGQIYWKGSHFERMQALLSRLLEKLD